MPFSISGWRIVVRARALVEQQQGSGEGILSLVTGSAFGNRHRMLI
ncbi:hypothetical protein IFO70_19235 [Phormidium tenue FACHB-886]|nr:hypothetical protein [Phormidium tenue FACHB-886]